MKIENLELIHRRQAFVAAVQLLILNFQFSITPSHDRQQVQAAFGYRHSSLRGWVEE